MINMLPENEKENVRVIFVSVDNERDTLQSLQKYIHPNGIQFVAGTADDKKLHAILAKYGARYARFRTKNKVLLVDHTDNVFVINKNGLWTDTLNFNSTPEQFLEAFRASDKITSETSKLGKNIQSIQLGKNNKCDLAKNECKIELPDHQTISVRLTPFPIKAQSDFTVSVKVTSDKLIPQEVDFNGVQLNMGYIRPALMLQEDGSYSATLNLPICELRKMQWKVSVILKDSLSRYFSTLFFFETKD